MRNVRPVLGIVLLLLSVVGCHASSHPAGDVTDVQTARNATRVAIEEMAGKRAADEADLSYVTPELLKTFRNAKRVPRDANGAKRVDPSARKGPDARWTYYGHHFTVLNAKQWKVAWINPNPDYSQPDRPDDRCYGTNKWWDYISAYYVYPACPPKTQGANSQSVGADPKL